MKVKEKNGRKYFLFWVVLIVLVGIFGATLLLQRDAVTEVSIGVFIGAILLLYLVYTFGNVLTKVSVGKYFSADLTAKKDWPKGSNVPPPPTRRQI